MGRQILFLIVMIAMCVIVGCIPQYYVWIPQEIKDDYVYIIPYTEQDEDQTKSDSSFQFFYFAESKESIPSEIKSQYGILSYDPMDPNSHYIFIGDSFEVLSNMPVKPEIQTVTIDGTTYTVYRYSSEFTGKMDGPLNIYVRNNTIEFMRIMLFVR